MCNRRHKLHGVRDRSYRIAASLSKQKPLLTDIFNSNHVLRLLRPNEVCSRGSRGQKIKQLVTGNERDILLSLMAIHRPLNPKQKRIVCSIPLTSSSASQPHCVVVWQSIVAAWLATTDKRHENGIENSPLEKANKAEEDGEPMRQLSVMVAARQRVAAGEPNKD